MDTKAVIARFEQERQALALMDHAHVVAMTLAGIAFNAVELTAGAGD
jgi:hypothetical protein